ncbi:hypothetical protein C7E18_23000, partial [Stenotrophomonas maltophilia]
MKEGEVDAVMGAYNRVYGESASASRFLLRDVTSMRGPAGGTCMTPTCRRSRRWVKEGEVDAVMGAYNRVYGESASASRFLLRDV